MHKPKESYKSNPKVATHQERANHQTAKPRDQAATKSFSQSQLQPTNMKQPNQDTYNFISHGPKRESLFLHTNNQSFDSLILSSIAA